VVTLLEISLREGDYQFRTIKVSRIVIRIRNVLERFKGIKKSALDIKEPIVKIILYKAVAGK
jgi:hypothetical protein